jgi:hypothetical protein
MGASGGRDETTDDGAEDERRDADDVDGGCGLLLGEGGMGCEGEAGGASAADTHASRDGDGRRDGGDGDGRRDGGGCTTVAAGGGEGGAATGASPKVSRFGAISGRETKRKVFRQADCGIWARGLGSTLACT